MLIEQVGIHIFYNMNHIGLVYLATSVYKNYFYNFLMTANNVFPEDRKTIVVISDGLEEFNDRKVKGIDIKVFKILDLPYPVVPMCKLRYLTYYTKEFDFDYILFFDSDTIFFSKPIEFWNELKAIMDNDKLIMSYHPHYLYNPDRIFNETFVIRDEQSCGYRAEDNINAYKTYVITSFFAGKYHILKKYDDLIYSMIGTDLSNIRKVPHYVDEAYMNIINVDENITDNKETLHIDNYITITPYEWEAPNAHRSSDNIFDNNFKEYSSIFMNQKYDVNIKNLKKQNKV